MRPILIYVLLISILCCRNTTAQQSHFHYPYDQLTTREGLAQMQIRDLHQDINGFVWIATQGGLSRFDGKEVVSYYEMDGLPEDQIISLTSDAEKVWGVTYQELFSFDGVEVRRYKLEGDSLFRFDLALFVDRNGYVWIDGEPGLVLFNEGRFTSIGERYPDLKAFDIRFARGATKGEKVYLIDRENRFMVYDLQTGDLQVDSTTFDRTKQVYFKTWGQFNKPDGFLIYTRTHGNSYYDDLYKMLGGTLQYVGSYRADLQAFENVSERAPTGLVIQPEEVNKIFIRHNHDYKQVNRFPFNQIRFCLSQKDRVFVATDDGVVTLFANGLETYENPFCNYNWSVAPFTNGSLLISCYRNGVARISPEGELLENYPFPPSDDLAKYAQILTNYAAGDAVLFGSIEGFYWVSPEHPELKLFALEEPVEALDYDEPKKEYLAAGKTALYRVDLTEERIVDKVTLPPDILNMVNANDICILDDRSVWVGGNGGLARYDEARQSWTVYTKEKGNFPCGGVVALASPDGQSLWIGSSCGLLQYDDRNDTFTRPVPPVTGRISNVHFLPDNQLAFTTKDALYIANHTGDSTRVTHVFDHRNGFQLLEPSENGMCYRDGYLWVPASNGIQRLDLDKLYDHRAEVRIHIDRIGTNRVPLRFTSGSVYPVKGSSHLVSFSLINHHAGTYQYQASINGRDFSQLQDAPEILVSQLENGRNEVVIRAVDGLHLAACPDFHLTLDVTLSFFQRTYTQVVGAILLLIAILAGTFFFLSDFRKKRRLEKMRRELALNRLKTIQAYLNPHFLFNTLTTIQNAILQKDKEEGNTMILSLSKLLRRVLDQGGEDNPFGLVTLRQEMEMIREYLFLENKQQEPPIRFQLDVHSPLDQDHVMVPPMILQPFVENAIIHAFTQKQSEKNIGVSCKQVGDKLQIDITDNGVGMHAGNQKSGRKSMGISLVKQRLMILRNFRFENQLVIQPHQPEGTKITLLLQLITL